MGHSFAEVDGKPQRVTPGATSLGLAVDAERKDGSRTLVVPVIRDAVGADVPRLRRRLRRAGRRRARQQAAARGLHGREHHADQPRRDRHGRLGAAPDAGPGHDRRHRRDRLPGRARAGRPGPPQELGVSKVMTMTSTYDHRVIQGAESGAFLSASTSCCRARTASTRACSARSASTSPRSRRPTATPPLHRGRARCPPAATPTVAGGARRGAAPGRPGRDLDRQGPPHARPSGRDLDPLGSPPPATPRSTRRPSDLTEEMMRHPGVGAARRGARQDLRRRPAAPARDLLRHDRLRDRAHRRPRAARLAAPDDRGGRAPPAARRPSRSAACSSGCPRSRRSRATCTRPSSARSSSRSRASTCSCRCSTR